MRVLVACEESQAVANEFRARGHEAYSCDLIACGGGHPEYHIQADAAQILKIRWDLIVAHPPHALTLRRRERSGCSTKTTQSKTGAGMRKAYLLRSFSNFFYMQTASM